MPKRISKKKQLAATLIVDEEQGSTSKKPRLKLTVHKKLVLSIDDYINKTPCNVLLTCGNGDIGQLSCGEHDPDEKCSNPKKVLRVAPHAENFLQIAAGSFHTVVLTDTNQVYTSGCNDDCALGRECWNDNGKSKRDDDQDCILRPVEALKHYVDQHGPVVQITAGDSHSAALTEHGSVLVWGTFRDKQGCLGMTANGVNSPSKPAQKINKGAFVAKSTTPALVSSYHQRSIVKIASGFNHLAMLASDGVIYTLGAGDAGQLGRLAPQFRDASASDRTKSRMLLPQVVAPKVCFNNVWCAGYCCFARATDDTIYVWGLNNYYQLGYVPNDPNEAIQYYPIKSDQFTKEHKWLQFSGDHHIVALDDKKNVYVIGRGDDSRLGTGKDGEQQTKVQLKSLDGTVLGVAAGNNCSFVWTKEGEAAAWGCDMEGEMGLGVEESETVITPSTLKADSLANVKIKQICVGGQHTVFLGSTNL